MSKYYVLVAGKGATSRQNVEALMEDHYYAKGDGGTVVIAIEKHATPSQVFVAQFAKDEYGFEPTNQVQDVTQPEPEAVVQDDARARVAALDANSRSDVPLDVMSQLDQIVATGDTKASIRARLALLDQEEKK